MILSSLRLSMESIAELVGPSHSLAHVELAGRTSISSWIPTRQRAVSRCSAGLNKEAKLYHDDYSYEASVMLRVGRVARPYLLK